MMNKYIPVAKTRSTKILAISNVILESIIYWFLHGLRFEKIHSEIFTASSSRRFRLFLPFVYFSVSHTEHAGAQLVFEQKPSLYVARSQKCCPACVTCGCHCLVSLTGNKAEVKMTQIEQILTLLRLTCFTSYQITFLGLRSSKDYYNRPSGAMGVCEKGYLGVSFLRGFMYAGGMDSGRRRVIWVL